MATTLVPPIPISRLLGVKTAHVSPGLVVHSMPAAESLVGANGQVVFGPLMVGALQGALMTAAGPGQDVQLLTSFSNNFRPARPSPGHLLARAHVVNASSLFAYAEVLVEDSEGRQLANGGGQGAMVTLDPPPPPPPSPLEPIEEPTWATPDPWQRPAAASISPSLWDTTDGVDIFRAISSGKLRTNLNGLLGLRIFDVERGKLGLEMPASKWFCAKPGIITPSILTVLIDFATWGCGLTMLKAGETFVGLDGHMRFYREVVPDGRPIRAEACHEFDSGSGVFVISTVVYDADGGRVATVAASGARVDNALRRRPRRRASERMLCTILFTDIVDSTARAESMGDAAWHELLQRHHEAARREIAVCDGHEVKTTGDGLLVRFASPARALDCAVRIRQSMDALGVKIRAGMHTGECEVTEEDVVGLAVHLASRIQAQAAPGEVLASSTVKDLAVGGGNRFEDRGDHRLKGIEEPWRLWSVC